MEISMAAPGAIWGTAIGAAIGGPAGAAIGQVAGLLIGSAMGAVISNYGNTSVISGRIADIDGVGIPGVCIETTGSNNGTVSDINGGFTLRVPFNAKIVVSSIGYKTEVIDTSNKGVLLVTLEEDSF